MDRRGNCSFLLLILWYHLKTLCTVCKGERDRIVTVRYWFFFFYHLGVWTKVSKLRKIIKCVDILKRMLRGISSARLPRKWRNSTWGLPPTTHLSLTHERGLEVNGGDSPEAAGLGRVLDHYPSVRLKQNRAWVSGELELYPEELEAAWAWRLAPDPHLTKSKGQEQADCVCIEPEYPVSGGAFPGRSGCHSRSLTKLSWRGPALEDCLLAELTPVERLGNDAGEGS